MAGKTTPPQEKMADQDNPDIGRHTRPEDAEKGFEDPDDVVADPAFDVREALAQEAETATQSPAPRKTIGMQQELKGLKSPHLPRKGPCTFLFLDLSSMREKLTDERTLKAILAEAKLVIGSKGFHVETDTKRGTLRILGTAERSEKSMIAIAQSLSRQIPMAKIFVGNGTIQYDEETTENKFFVYDAPTDVTMRLWRQSPAGTHLTPGLSAEMQDPESRKSSGCYIETGEADDVTGLVPLLKYEPKLSLHVGGPDRLIGYEQELLDLHDCMTNDETRLFVLEGGAGMGKSRLLATALQDLPSSIVCSLDAADKNLAGASLVTLADQLAYTLSQNPFLEEDEEEPVASHQDEESSNSKSIQQFSKKSRAEKITLAQKNPKLLAEMCGNALVLLNFERGYKTVFILEDIHFADRFSERWLIQIAQDYLIKTEIETEVGGKAGFTMRPEEMYRSNAVSRMHDSVSGFFGDDSLKKITLGGLDFSDPKISREFAFHSLPKKIREKADGTAKTLGQWPEKLGKVSGRSPFRMKTFMDTVKEGSNLTVDDETIDVDRAVIERIEQIKEDGDLATHYHERIERLEDKSKLAVQLIALAGGRLPGRQIESILRTMVAGTEESFVRVVADLQEGGYICEVPNQGEAGKDVWQLQHDSLRQIIIDSIQTSDERKRYAMFLYHTLREDSSMHPDTQFELLHHMAIHKDTTPEDTAVWGSYERVVSEMLADARSRNATSKAYTVAEAILDDHRGVQVVKDTIARIKQGEEVPLKLRSIALQALYAKAESAVYLAKAQDARAAIADLREIHTRYPDLVDINRINLIEFEVAYVSDEAGKANNQRLTAFYAQNIAPETVSISPAEKIITQIKLYAKIDQNKQAIQTFEENQELLEALNEEHKAANDGMPHPHFMEAKRMATLRCPFEILRKRITKVNATRTLDEDVMLHDGAVPLEHQGEVLRIMSALADLKSTKEKFPLIFNPYAEIGLLGIEAQLHAFSGDLAEAKKCFAEGWRQADQAEVPRQGVRFAKMEGDITVIEALKLSQKDEKIAKLEEAIRTYTEKGIASLAQIDEKDFYQAGIRIQRIRAIGILALTHELESISPPIPMALKLNITPHIQQAVEDFKHVNGMYGRYVQYLRDHQEDETGSDQTKKDKYLDIKNWIAGIGYYMTGYMGHIIKAARILDIQLEKSIFSEPFMDGSVVIGNSLAIAGKTSDRGFSGEVRRKINGLSYLFTSTDETQIR